MENSKNKFRLPTRKEFENLDKYSSKWDEEKKSLEISNDKGDILFLPASGYYLGTLGNDVGSCGYYWSSTTYTDRGYDGAFYFNFDWSSKDVCPSNGKYKQSIRLVSDTPFDEGIKFGNIWWKPENEDGYYSYEEAMNKFNNK